MQNGESSQVPWKRETPPPALQFRLDRQAPDAPPNRTQDRYFFGTAAPTVYLGSTKLPSRTLPHWLSIM